MTGTVSHPLLGEVEVVSNSRSVRLTARWKSGHVRLTVPNAISEKEIMHALDSMAPKLLSCKPRHASYADGHTIDCGDLRIIVTRQSHRPSEIMATPKIPVTCIEVGTSLKLDSPEVSAMISRRTCRVAEALAERLLLPRAMRLAAELDLHPAEWRIGSGRKVLGTCSSRGVITLSYMIVFLPLELRDFIVLHELAHLREMNHSPRFHALLGQYCGGKEARLRLALRTFDWPVARH